MLFRETPQFELWESFLESMYPEDPIYKKALPLRKGLEELGEVRVSEVNERTLQQLVEKAIACFSTEPSLLRLYPLF